MPGATYTGAFAAVAGGIAGIGAAARSTVTDLKAAASEAKAFTAEIEAARNTTSGMTSASGAGSTNTNLLAAALKAVR